MLKAVGSFSTYGCHTIPATPIFGFIYFFYFIMEVLRQVRRVCPIMQKTRICAALCSDHPAEARSFFYIASLLSSTNAIGFSEIVEIESWKAWSSVGQRLGCIVWLGGFITSWHYFTNECAPVAQPDRATDF